MKFSLKTLAAAIVMAAAASGASADITVGGGAGNGELFFNIWDANGSYTRGLGTKIDSFQGTLATAGSLDLFWGADATLTSFLNGTTGGTRSGALQWNILATDQVGQARLLSTYTAPEQSVTKPNEVVFSAAAATTNFLNKVNPLIPGTTFLNGASLAVDSASTGFAGQATFNNNVGGLMDFSNAGTIANSSFVSGLGFMRMDAPANNTGASTYNEYYDPSNNLVASITNPVGGNAVHAYFDASNTLHIQAMPVPEPESYAMLLAGLGMLGFMARRRLNNRV